jgi:t-SNARE complex subunit (syntaxin)
MSDNIEIRFSKVDEAIQRLASVAADLSKLLAVQEQRIAYQEKASDNINNSLEKMKDDFDQRFNHLQESLKKETEENNKKFIRLEKILWMACGGGVMLGWLLTYGIQIYRLIP